MRIPINMYFDHEKDRDVLSYMDSMSAVSRNRLVRDLLRQHMAGGVETTRDTLIRLERKLDSLSSKTFKPSEFTDAFTRREPTIIEVDIGDDILSEIERNLASIGD